MDVRCGRVAEPQFGLITRSQARAEGASDRQIDHRVATKLWRVVHPGVYAIAAMAETWHQDQLAACMWSGGISSHRSAAVLWDLPGFTSKGTKVIDVTVTRCHLPPRCGIKVHHTNRLLESDRVKIGGIPVTGVERTLLDLGAVRPISQVAAALDAALVRELTTLDRLDEYLRLVAKRGRRGCKGLRRLIRQRVSIGKAPESPLETRFFQLMLAEGLPSPELQFEIRHEGRFVARVDFAWPTEKVILEMDGFRYHSGHVRWERDRARRNELTLLGWRILHGTWSDAYRRPRLLLDRVATALAQKTELFFSN